MTRGHSPDETARSARDQMPLSRALGELIDSADRLCTESSVEDARMALADLVACAVAAGGPAVQRTAADAEESGVYVWSTGEVASPEHAVRRNAFDAHRMDWDSLHYLTFGHPAVVLFPALVAEFELGSLTAGDVLNGYVVGVELMAVLGGAFGRKLQEAGFHPTAVLGSITVAVVLGWLSGGEVARLSQAASLAALSCGGQLGAFGGTGKAFQVAAAGATGSWAAAVAMTGAELSPTEWWRPLSHLVGEQVTASSWRFGEPAAVATVATRIKRLPVCGYFDQVLSHLENQLPRLMGTTPVAVTVEIPQYVEHAIRAKHPDDDDEARFSLVHLAAATLLGMDLAADLAVFDEAVARLRSAVRLEPLAGDLVAVGDRLIGRCVIELADGHRVESELVYGIERHHLTWPDTAAKVANCLRARGVTNADARRLAAGFTDRMRDWDAMTVPAWRRCAVELVAGGPS